MGYDVRKMLNQAAKQAASAPVAVTNSEAAEIDEAATWRKRAREQGDEVKRLQRLTAPADPREVRRVLSEIEGGWTSAFEVASSYGLLNALGQAVLDEMRRIRGGGDANVRSS